MLKDTSQILTRWYGLEREENFFADLESEFGKTKSIAASR
jgi:hypothetical protein